MRRGAIRRLLVLAALASLAGCFKQPPPNNETAMDSALAARIEELVESLLTSDGDTQEARALAEARAIFEREGIPSLARVGDAAAYGFVLINVLGQPADFRQRIFTKVQEAGLRNALPEDAVVFAEARRRQAEVEERYSTHAPSHPELRDRISRLLEKDQAVREKTGFNLEKMNEQDLLTAGPLKAIFAQYGVPTYDMVGVQASKDFIVMVQHQPPEFRRAVLPKLKLNVDAGQADPGAYAMVYDRTQRDQGRNQLYGEQLECTTGKSLDLAPIDDATEVNLRRARLGLMRVELYARLVRLSSPDICGSAKPPR
jgi:hypothetical protein